MPPESFRVFHIDLATGSGQAIDFGNVATDLGGSGLAAALFEQFGDPAARWDEPSQPVIFAVGPLTGYLPLMSKVVCGFKSPYHDQYTESHAGGRMALALRFTGYHALVITGRAERLSCLVVGSRRLELRDVHYLAGRDALSTGKLLRRAVPAGAGHRSIARIGPAGEGGVAFASINVDTYRHFGRLGAGAALGRKNLKAVVLQGDASVDLPPGKAYPALCQEAFQQVTATDMMRKYHDLGTPENVLPLNELHALPWRNLQATHDPDAAGISGERFAEQLLLRQAACAGCPVGCIHIGLLRQRFAADNEFLYRQVSYDHEPVFAQGSMLGITRAPEVLTLLEASERLGLDVMSAGVALAWATEAFQGGLIGEDETLVRLAFGEAAGYVEALRHLGHGTNEFYRLLGRGTETAAAHYGGAEFACVLGQEMAGYATGEVFFASQALGFRHSHLDAGGYAYDQKTEGKDVAAAVAFLVEDERRRVLLTSMVGCLFARSVYGEQRLAEALECLGWGEAAAGLEAASRAVQARRWALRLRSGFAPRAVRIPKRFLEVVTWKGPLDPDYLAALCTAYARRIEELARSAGGATP